MEGSVGLIEHELVRASEQDGDSLVIGGALGHLHDLGRATGGLLGDEASSSKLFGLELVNVGNRGRVDGLADEFNVVTLDVLDYHNLFLGEEVKSEVADGLTKHTLLQKEHVGSRSDDFLDDSKNVLALLADDSVHGLVVADDNIRLHVTLGGADRELNQSDFGVLNTGGAASQVGRLLVDEAEAVDELRLVNGAAKFLANADVTQVDVRRGGLIDDLEDGIDCHGGEQVGMMRDNLGGEGGDSVLNERVAVFKVDRLGHIVDDFHGLLVGFLEAIRNSGGVKSLGHQVLGGSEESTRHNDD